MDSDAFGEHFTFAAGGCRGFSWILFSPLDECAENPILLPGVRTELTRNDELGLNVSGQTLTVCRTASLVNLSAGCVGRTD